MQAVRYQGRLSRLIPRLQQLLQEGALREEFVLDSVPKLLNTARECNVTLRWLLLHTVSLSHQGENWAPCTGVCLLACTASQSASRPRALKSESSPPTTVQRALWVPHSLAIAAGFPAGGGELNKKCRQLRDQVHQDSKYQPLAVFQLLLHTAQFELKLKEVSVAKSWRP